WLRLVPGSTLFPYTTLFRSSGLDGASEVRAVGDSVVIYIKDGSAAIASIVLRLSEASIPVQEVTLARPTLDDVFLRKTGYHIERSEEHTSELQSRVDRVCGL